MKFLIVLFLAASALAQSGFNVPATGNNGLNIIIGPGTVTDSAGVTHTYAGGTLPLLAKTTNYGFVDSTATVGTNTTGVPAGDYPLFTAVTGETQVKSVVDLRPSVFFPISPNGNNVLTGTNPFTWQLGGATVANFNQVNSNSTQFKLSSQAGPGTYNLIMNSDADGMGDISSPTGLEFCGTGGCGTTSQTNIFFFPQGNATSGANFNGELFALPADFWNGSANAYDLWQFQDVCSASGANPQCNFEFTHSGTTGFTSYSFLNSPVQVNMTGSGDSARLQVQATSGNASFSAYNHSGSRVFFINDQGNLAINNCSQGGASGTTSPAACSAASTGIIAVPSSQTTYTVNTSAVAAASEIFLEQMTDNSNLSGSPSCSATAANPMQSARVNGTSFTFTLTSVAAVTCFKFLVLN